MNEENNQLKADQSRTGKEIQINLDQTKLESHYSDIAFISMNPMGLTFDFGQNIPQMNMVKIVTRLSVSPQHAKALLNLLKQNIDNYERQFGEIKMTQPMQEQQNSNIGFKISETSDK